MTTAPSVATLLYHCRSLRDLQQIHALLIRKGLHQHPVLANRFLSLCSRLSLSSYALQAFASLAHPNLLLFNALLSALAGAQAPLPSLFPFFNLLRRSFAPDAFTFPPLLSACALASHLPAGQAIHASALRYGIHRDLFVRTALIDFYGKCRQVRAARLLFESMDVRNVVSWTAMVVACLHSGEVGLAWKVFDEMPERNVVAWNAMIGGCIKSGDLVGARTLFDEMPERNVVSFTLMIDGYAKSGDMASAKVLFRRLEVRDLVSWSAMISGYAQNGRPGDALDVFMEMYSKNVKPDEFVLVGLMSACSQLSCTSLAKWVDSYVLGNVVDVKKPYILAALVDMNAKCGNMERAASLFEIMENKDLVSYCSLMQGYCLHGSGKRAVDLFLQMLQSGITPDEVAFTVVLTACSHVGLVEEGKKYFEMMKNDYLIAPCPEHYACMVYLLGRAGRLDEAYELLKSMSVFHAGAWGAMLGACRMYSDTALGESVARRLFEIEPQNGGNYVALSDIYAANGRWEDVLNVRLEMKERGIKKIAGCTQINFGG